MKIAFISRTNENNNLEFDLGEMFKEIAKILPEHEVEAYITANFESCCEVNSIKTKIIKTENPISPVAMNIALQYIRENETDFDPDAFLICSKEVEIKNSDFLRTLIKEIHNNPWLLVVGYKFKHDDDQFLENELSGCYANKNLIAYRVPWNTCAMWNYKLFNGYVGKFDEITLGKYPFEDIQVKIGDAIKNTQHKGMEDGLAIARAVSKSKEIRFKLLKNKLNWKVDHNKLEKHLAKLARKDCVMRNFMAIRNYSIKDLELAEIS